MEVATFIKFNFIINIASFYAKKLMRRDIADQKG